MLKQIGEQRPSGEPLLQALLDCHLRIRRFTALAARLADPAATRSELADAAASVHRYFTVALPQHAADEELSVAPRLIAVAPELAEAVARIDAEHVGIMALVAELAPLWQIVAADPGRAGELAGRLVRLTARLDALFAAHLGPEERQIFPALERISPEERAAALVEMKARRATR